MKKLLFFFSFVLFAGALSAQKQCTAAQKAACAKSGKVCVKGDAKADMTAETSVAAALAAAELAETDENIEQKVCAKSGNVSYYSKKVCPASGKITKSEVMYSAESNSFVNVSPIDVMAEKEATAVKAAAVESNATTKSKKKACCAGKKACSSKKTGA